MSDDHSSKDALLDVEKLVARSELERNPREDIEQVPEKINETIVLEALQSIEVPVNENRQNVKINLDEEIRSCTFGALARSNSPARISEMSRHRPRLTHLLARFGKEIACPANFPFTSIQLNKNYASAMHCDSSNDGPSCIYALGDFVGGELWTLDRGIVLPRGDASANDRVFNGNQPHCTLAFRGERYSLIFFSTAGHDRMNPQDAQVLDVLGFRLPPKRLTHVYMSNTFPAPHLEHNYTFGFHVSMEERCDDAKRALDNWLSDWHSTYLPSTTTNQLTLPDPSWETSNKFTQTMSSTKMSTKKKSKMKKSADDRMVSSENAAKAFASRNKPGSMAPNDVCEGLLLGFARLASNKHRGDDRDGYLATGALAICPLGLRGPLTGVVVFHERCTIQSTINPNCVAPTDIFGVFYQDGRFEELELEELAQALEPPAPNERQRAAAPLHIEWSAPELARKMLQAKHNKSIHLLAERKLLTQRYQVSDIVLTQRSAANAALMNAFENSLTEQRRRHGDTSPYPSGEWWCTWLAAAAHVVKPSGVLGHLSNMTICDAMIAAPRILVRSYGGFSDENNVLAIARAAGLWPPNLPLDAARSNFNKFTISTEKNSPINDSPIAIARKRKRDEAQRQSVRFGCPAALGELKLSRSRLVLTLILAVEARLVRLGFSDGSASDQFKPTLEDLCLDHEARVDKFEEQGPAPLNRPTMVRAILEREIKDACTPRLENSWPSLELRVPMLLENLRNEIDRELPPASWTERYGEIVWIPADESHHELIIENTETNNIGRTGLEGLLRNVDDRARRIDKDFNFQNGILGLTLRRKTQMYGILSGRVVAVGPKNLGARKFLVEYDDNQGSEWLSEPQLMALAHDPLKSENPEWKPAVILDPSFVAAILCTEPPSSIKPASIAALSRAARSGYTFWGRAHLQRRVDQSISALRLLGLIEKVDQLTNDVSEVQPTFALVKDSQCLDWHQGMTQAFF
mmetsp:Transcript_7548/g.11309  ORF Transcript_7548/g.11309 Transcript_7548/m.11309 type:complete len:977 (+) Transcript_7548:51-2981(+)